MNYRTLPTSLLAVLAFVFMASPLAAQYDDVYFTPSEEPARESRTINGTNDYTSTDGNYDDDFDRAPQRNNYQSDAAASDYEYTSRIRRFRRPVGSFNYYDPFYVDAGYYDPFFRGGPNTVLIYNTPSVAFQRVYTPFGSRVVAVDRFGYANSYASFGYGNRFNRFNRFNAWNDPFFNGGGLGWNNGFNRFGGWNNGFGGGWNNSFAVGGIGGGYYCPPAFGNTAYNVAGAPQRIDNRRVTTRPRGSTTSIQDRIDRNRTTVRTSRGSNGGDYYQSGGRGSSTRSAPATRSANRPTTTRSRGSYPSTRSRSSSSRSTTTRSASPSRSARPATRSYTPGRSASPSRSRSVSPSRSRSASPSRSRSASPSRGSSSRGRSGSSRGGHGY